MHPAMYSDMLIYAFESLACLLAALLAVFSYVLFAR